VTSSASMVRDPFTSSSSSSSSTTSRDARPRSSSSSISSSSLDVASEITRICDGSAARERAARKASSAASSASFRTLGRAAATWVNAELKHVASAHGGAAKIVARDVAYGVFEALTRGERYRGFAPNAYVCTTVVSVVGAAKDVDGARDVIGWMERNSEENVEVAPTTYTYTSYIQALDKVGRWEDAFEVLERMRRRGVARSAHTYSALVRAGANGGKLGARAAIELIPSMKSDLIEPDLAIASALICAFGVLGSEENARAMLRAIESSGRGVDAKLYTDYITAMCRCGNYDEAKEVFGRVSPRTTFTCTAVMKAYAEAMEWTLAEALFEEMCINGPKPNDQTHTAILHAYEKSLEWERAVRLLNQLSSRGQAKEIHHNIVLSVLGKCSQWQRAEILFKDMRELYNIRPSRVTYSTLISAYGRSGKTELARKVFLQMLAKRIEPDDYTFVGLMLGPATAGNFRECAKIASEMKDYGVKPTVHTYNTLIQAADIAGNYDKAVELYDELLREGIEPNNTTRELVVAVANRGASFYDRQQKTAAVASYAAGLVGVMGMALGRW